MTTWIPTAPKETITMAPYLLSVWHDSHEFPEMAPEDMERMFAQVPSFNEALQGSGSWVFAGGLQPVTTATVVNASTTGDPVITDGPYAEFEKQMGGFWVIEAKDLDEALDWARKGSAACEGPVEVRPFQGEPEG